MYLALCQILHNYNVCGQLFMEKVVELHVSHCLPTEICALLVSLFLSFENCSSFYLFSLAKILSYVPRFASLSSTTLSYNIVPMPFQSEQTAATLPFSPYLTPSSGTHLALFSENLGLNSSHTAAMNAATSWHLLGR